MTAPSVLPRQRVTGVWAGIGFAVLAAAALTWAKWWPYAHKLAGLGVSRHWAGRSVTDTAGVSGHAPSWSAAWAFTVAYGSSVWVALLAALVIAAAVDALLPQHRVVQFLTRRTRLGGTVTGGLLALPSMMCTCCTAPVANTLRRRGAPTESVVAYWLANPVLNPAVLAFLVLAAPWQWAVTRLVVGTALVLLVASAVARGSGSSGRPLPVAAPTPAPVELANAARRFARTFLRLAGTLVPEYLLVVLAVGAVSGWLFPPGGNGFGSGVTAVMISAVVGTAMVIPTAGEIPLMLGLSAAGAGSGVLGALLITLPAVSIPSLVMVSRALGVRVTMLTAAGVVVGGVVAGALLSVLA